MPHEEEAPRKSQDTSLVLEHIRILLEEPGGSVQEEGSGFPAHTAAPSWPGSRQVNEIWWF